MAIKKKLGRPSKFSPEIAEEICERIANGESLRKICDEPPMPVRTTVRTWLLNNGEFQTRYARAREDQADHFAEMIIDVAFSSSDPQMGRLQMDALKWTASKMAPRKYGDKIEHEVNGELDIVVKIGGSAQ